MDRDDSDIPYRGPEQRPSESGLDEAKDVLASTPVACLAMSDAGSCGRPYAVPVNFAYVDGDDRGRIVFHTGEGRKSRALAADPRVCLTMVADTRFDLGPEPCLDEFSYRSVIVEGTARLLETTGERETGLRAIVAKYDPEAADRPFDDDTFERTLVYSVAIEALSYKQRPERR